MSVESKIRELMQGTKASTTPEVLGEAAPMGAESVQKDQSIKAQVAGDATNPMQGSSQAASYEEREEDEENQGAVASKSTPSSPRPQHNGPGAAPNYMTTADPTSVVNMPSSKGNVAMESAEQTINVKAELSAILGEDASEEFRTKATSLFEAAVIARVNAEMDNIIEALENKAVQQITEAKEEMVEKVDAYLSYVVEHWVQDNQLAVDSGLRTEIAEDFITGLKSLFAEHYIEVPEEKYNVVDEMQEEISVLESKLDEAVNTNVQLSSEVTALKKAKIFEAHTKDLAETESEKLGRLIEGIDFEDESLFSEKVAAIKETYFPKSSKAISSDQLTEDVTSPATFDSFDTMSKYVQAISRSVKTR